MYRHHRFRRAIGSRNLLAQHHQIVLNHRNRRRRESIRITNEPFGLIEITASEMDHAKHMQRIDILGLDLQHLAVKIRGRLEIPALLCREREIHRCPNRQRHRRRRGSHRFRAPPRQRATAVLVALPAAASANCIARCGNRVRRLVWMGSVHYSIRDSLPPPNDRSAQTTRAISCSVMQGDSGRLSTSAAKVSAIGRLPREYSG
jgi:hypothetical protein